MSKRRRPRGEGSVWFDAGRGLWVGRLPLPPGPRGQRRRSRPVYAPTEKQALAKLDDLRGGPVDRTRQTLAQYLTWYVDHHMAARQAEGEVDPATVRSYRQNLTGHVAPHIGGVKLVDVEPEHLDELKAAWARTGLAASTRKLVWSQLRFALRTAERYRRITRNWCDVVPGPRGKGPPKGQWLSPSDALALLEATAGDRLAAYYRVGVALGLRVGEACGLEWRHVDLDAGTLRVEQQLQRVKGGWQVKALKGREWGEGRDVPLPAFVAESLREHRKAQLAERLRVGWTDPPVDAPDGRRQADLVFRTRGGLPWHRNMIAREIERACEAAEIGRRTPHDLRRSAASFLAAEGVDVTVTMAICGWRSAQVALEVYQRATEEGLTAAAKALDDLLGG